MVTVYLKEREDNMENHKNEFTFSNKSIIAYVWRGVMVGIIAGVIVSLFRLLIEVTADWVIEWYRYAHINSLLLLPILKCQFVSCSFCRFFSKV